MGGTLDVSERILFHLHNYLKHEDKFEDPFDITQDDIFQGPERDECCLEL